MTKKLLLFFIYLKCILQCIGEDYDGDYKEADGERLLLGRRKI